MYTVLVSTEKEKNYFCKRHSFISIGEFFLEEAVYEAYSSLKKAFQEKNLYLEEISFFDDQLFEYQVGLAIKVKFFSFPDRDFFLSTFGFIVREEAKDFLWIRYVGKIPARILFQKKISLEEYLDSFACVLVVDKPVGITSFDVVKKISELYGISRVGHTGTLDPIASGVMLVTVGKATKIVELLTAQDKEYIASFELGYRTDTYDSTGEVLDRKEIPSNIHLKEVIQSFQKTYSQEVPIYSAVKVNGKKLYEYARSGMDVDLPKREVTIKEIELLEEKQNSFTFRALVTKGCYIRSLIHDIGLSLGVYATMTSLSRTRQGNVYVKDASSLEEIESGLVREYDMDEVLDYPIIVVDSILEKKIKNGMRIPNIWNIQDKVLFKNEENHILGIYEVSNQDLITWKNF